MALPRKEDFDSRLETKKTVQRLASVVEEQRFLTSVSSQLENRFHLIISELTDYIEGLVNTIREVTETEEREPPTEQINQVFAELDAELALVQTPDGQYTEFLRRRNEARQALENFKYKHDLHEPPIIAESEVWHWATLLALLFAETMINSFSFGEVSAMGLVGGFGQAFLFAIVNLALAYLAGNFFKFKNHYDSNLRIAGWAVFAFFLIIIFLYNLFVGHYREALGAPDFETALSNTGTNFAKDIFGISDGGALLLVVLGFIIAIIAFLKNYNFEDPYPGYSKIGKREQDAVIDLLARREEVRLPKLRKVYEEAIGKLRQLSFRYTEHVGMYDLMLSSKKRVVSDLSGSVQGFRGVLRELLLDFRAQLQRAPLRHTSPEINVDDWCSRVVPANPIPSFDFTAEEEALDKMREKLRSFDVRIEEEVANLNADLGKDIDALKSAWDSEDEGAVEAV